MKNDFGFEFYTLAEVMAMSGEERQKVLDQAEMIGRGILSDLLAQKLAQKEPPVE